MPREETSTIDWTNIRKELEKEKDLLQGSGDITMPVTYDAQGQNPRWERLDHEVIKELAKAIRDNGLNSQYFKQLLKGTFNMYDFTPYDVRCLVSMILTDTQSLVWDAKWRRALAGLRLRYQGGPNANLTMTQLAGDPPDDNPTQQARLPRDVLNDIKEVARRAILQIAPAGVQDTLYTNIKQGPAEPFSSFTDRLTQAVDRQVSDEAAKPHIIKSLAYANANPDCQRVISAMPGQPSLAEMVEVCSKVGTPQHVASIVKQQLRGEWEEQFEGRLGEKMEEMLQKQNEKFDKIDKLLANIEKKASPSKTQCYKCGEFGHIKKNCPQAQAKTQTQASKPEKPLCPRCRRGRHPANECYSLTDVDGKPLPIPGNGRGSAHHRQCVLKEVMAMAQEPTGQSLENAKSTPSAESSAGSPATQNFSHQDQNAFW